jgi:hypothetical protein
MLVSSPDHTTPPITTHHHLYFTFVVSPPGIFLKLVFCLLGLLTWEVVTQLPFDFSIILGRVSVMLMLADLGFFMRVLTWTGFGLPCACAVV